MHGVQAVEPDGQDVLGGAAGEQAQVLARGNGPLGALLLGVRDIEEAGVYGEPPGLAGVRGAVVVGREPEVLGGRGQLRLDEFAAGADTGVGTGPPGEPDGPDEQRSGERVPCQFGLGVEPHRRQGGALCGHRGFSSVRARGRTECVRGSAAQA
ncbi:hypothetical protein P376_4620 [Streptomyces sp. HCCB10043]|nr:hypothetical protein P376_4620 [Streptomyces sp. HCCB10043]